MTQSLEDYLEMVLLLIDDGAGAHVRDVAERLHVKMPSVVKAVSELKKLELVNQEPYGAITLTEKGARLAKLVHSRHTLLRSFLLRLGVSERIAERDACTMEHFLSAETLDAIRGFLGADAPARKAPPAKRAPRGRKGAARGE